MKFTKTILCCLLFTQLKAQVKIRLTLDSSLHKTMSGRVFIYTQSDTSKQVPNQPDPTQPMFAFQVKDWRDIITVELDARADHMPVSFSSLKPGYYKIAGIIDADPTERGSSNPGNVYARQNTLLYVNEKGEGETVLQFASVVTARKFTDNDSLKQLIMKSNLLSAFRKKDIFIQSAVKLPASYYKEPSRMYPVVFVIPGWGGTHYDLQNPNQRNRYGMNIGKEKIYVYLNPENQSPFGLHAFVDSRVNGPWGKALVEELVPYLQHQYRINTDPSQHFVMGQSTGGYGSIWLQLNYPDAFGGCWGVSPDPVDFSVFLGVDLYEKNVNVFTGKDGQLRPFYFVDGKPLSTVKEFADMETFTGDGEQMQAFEAEFGMPDAQGRPRQIYDRKTGALNTAVVATWEPYNLGKFIQKNWKKMENRLSGKVHIYSGANDNFYLNTAVEALAVKANSVNAKLVAEIIPNSDHWSIWSSEFTQRVQREIDERIR